MKEQKKNIAWLKILSNMDIYIGGAVFGVLVTLTFINVLMRYIFRTPISWSEEMILIQFAWSTYLGIVACFRYDKHMRITFIFDKLPKPVQKVIDIGTDIMLLALFGYLTYLSSVLCANVGVKKTLVMRLPANVVNLTLLVCFGVMAVSCAFKIYHKIRGTYELDNPLADVEAAAKEMN